MPRKKGIDKEIKAINDRYWNSVKIKQIKEEYESYLKENGDVAGPDSAHAFAMRKITGGNDYLGFTERNIILLLAGELPFMYD